MNRPCVTIGYGDSICEIQDVIYGIEEEGCLYLEYKAAGRRDHRYSGTHVNVMVYGDEATLNVYENGETRCVYNVEATSFNLRGVGVNASRYLKNRKLKFGDKR